MPVEAKTIQIYLPDGQPRGVRIAEITTRIVQALAFPRAQLDAALARDEAGRVALYFLLGQTDEQVRPTVYIGQTEDIPTRMRDHNAKKDFWQTAIWVTSSTQSFTQAHIRYLEWFSIKTTREAGRFALDNGNEGAEPYVTEPIKADILDAFDTARTLLGTLGYPVFEPLTITGPLLGNADTYTAKGPDADAKARYTDDGFVVLKGSLARAALVDSVRGTFLESRRRELVEGGVLVPDGASLRFAEDWIFTTPSGAAMVVLGRTANGWKEWYRADGRTLHDVIRAPSQPASPH
jgi:hypothetical protein